jgi:hypothetical protein
MNKLYIVSLGNGYYCQIGKDSFYQQSRDMATVVDLKTANIALDALRSLNFNAEIEFAGDTQ